MRKNKVLLNGTCLLIAGALMLCTSSCGTILYPERRGQAAGRLDAGVAVLDGIGLLLFIVPGVIAFAVDFATGAIYLPAGHSRADLDPADLQNARVIQTHRTSLTLYEIEALVEQQIGQDIELGAPETRVARIYSGQDLVWGSISDIPASDPLGHHQPQEMYSLSSAL